MLGGPAPFLDRRDAGRRLGDLLSGTRFERPVVLGLPRGGVPVAAEVAAVLAAPLDVLVARKIGHPAQEELGVGAVAEGLAAPVYSELVTQLGLTPDDLEGPTRRARAEVERQVALYRAGRPPAAVEGAEVVVVDDGLATGVTARAALRAARRRRPERLMMAAPVCARGAPSSLAGLADDVVCLLLPAEFVAVGQWYEDFSPTTDEDVLRTLGGGLKNSSE